MNKTLEPTQSTDVIDPPDVSRSASLSSSDSFSFVTSPFGGRTAATLGLDGEGWNPGNPLLPLLISLVMAALIPLALLPPASPGPKPNDGKLLNLGDPILQSGATNCFSASGVDDLRISGVPERDEDDCCCCWCLLYSARREPVLAGGVVGDEEVKVDGLRGIGAGMGIGAEGAGAGRIGVGGVGAGRIDAGGVGAGRIDVEGG